jgi:hypothetical protein
MLDYKILAYKLDIKNKNVKQSNRLSPSFNLSPQEQVVSPPQKSPEAKTNEKENNKNKNKELTKAYTLSN